MPLNLASLTGDALADNRPGTPLFRHPEYMLRWWWREFNRVSYVGGREYHRPARLSIEFQEPVPQPRNVDGTIAALAQTDPAVNRLQYQSLLFRHSREKSWEFENRRKRAYYFNFVASTVNSICSHALKKPPTRDGDEQLKEFWDGVDCDRSTNMNRFVVDGAPWAQLYGLHWACMDVDNDPDDKDADGKPYLYWVSPLDVFDWSVDSDGEIEWLKQFIYTEAERTWKDKVLARYRIRVWDKQKVETYDIDPNNPGAAELVPELSKAHQFGRVPFEPLYSRRVDDYPFPDGIPLAGDLCKIANHVYNLCSLLSEVLYKQTFSWLAIPSTNIDVAQIGVNTAFGYDPAQTGGARPEYLSPDADQARVILEAIAAALEQAKSSFGTGRGRQEGSMQKSTAQALELESEDKRSILTSLAGECEDFERRIAGLFAATRNGAAPEADPHIQYQRDFDLRALTDEINESLALRNLSMSPEIMLELRKDAVRKRFPSMPRDEMDGLLATLLAEPATPPQLPLDSQGGDRQRPNQMDPMQTDGKGVGDMPAGGMQEGANRPHNAGQADQRPQSAGQGNRGPNAGNGNQRRRAGEGS